MKTSHFNSGLLLLLFGICIPAQAQWSVQQLGTPRRRHCSAVTSQALYVASGETNTWTAGIEILDRATGQVTNYPLSTPRAEVACAAAEGFVLFAGGRTNCTQQVCVSALVDVYHEPSGILTQDLLPVPITSATGHAFGAQIFIAGGLQVDPPRRGIVQVLDVPTWTWSVIDLGPEPFTTPSVANDDRWLAVIGGMAPWLTPIIRIYDSMHGTWESIVVPGSAPNPLVGTLIDGRIYIGWGYYSPILDPVLARSLRVYDIATRTWSTSPLPSQRSNPYVSGVGPYVVAANGNWNGWLAGADVFDTLTNEWHTFDLPASRARSLALDASGETLFLSGGDPSFSGQGITDRIDVFHASSSLGQAFCGPAQPNSTGRSARIAAAGLDVAADEFLTLYVKDAPIGQFGQFIISPQAAGPSMPVGSSGRLCLAAPLTRLGYSLRAVNSDGVLAASLRFQAAPFPAPLSALVGTRWHFQAWFRDAQAGSPTSNFSDALTLDFR